MDEDGQYFDPDLDVITSNEQEKPSGKIHITFAENRYMNIRYYADSSMKTPINTTSCYLNPGNRLYAKVKYLNRTQPFTDLRNIVSWNTMPME